MLIEGIKAQIDFIKYIFSFLTAFFAGLISYFFLNFEKHGFWFLFIVFIGVICVIIALKFVTIAYLQKIKELKEA